VLACAVLQALNVTLIVNHMYSVLMGDCKHDFLKFHEFKLMMGDQNFQTYRPKLGHF
jgi:hypothetical protein